MATQQINVHNLPRHVSEEELAGSAVVVIDLLRASTTICQALASGAREVVPFLEVEEALAAAAKDAQRGEILLGGERHGKRIDGFDLGNGPAEYTREAVGGRRVFITTTNGTRALQKARLANRVLVGAAVNLSAVAASLTGEPRVDILCAGTDGAETGEDILAAGAFVEQLRDRHTGDVQLNESATAALDEWQSLVASATAKGRSVVEQLALAFRETPGGRNLVAIGYDRDLVDCAQIDQLAVVPGLDLRTWRIRLV